MATTVAFLEAQALARSPVTAYAVPMGHYRLPVHMLVINTMRLATALRPLVADAVARAAAERARPRSAPASTALSPVSSSPVTPGAKEVGPVSSIPSPRLPLPRMANFTAYTGAGFLPYRLSSTSRFLSPGALIKRLTTACETCWVLSHSHQA